MRLCFLVMRKTYGFQKKEDWLALSQIRDELGLKDKSHARRLVQRLVKLGVLNQSKEGERKNILSINQNFTEWEGLLDVQIEDINFGKDRYQFRVRELSRMATTKENLTKENLKKDGSNEPSASPSGLQAFTELVGCSQDETEFEHDQDSFDEEELDNNF
jgi:hypothetical protein